MSDTKTTPTDTTSDEILMLETRDDTKHAAIELVQQCRTNLAFATREMDPLVYGRQDFVTALQALATKSQYVMIRILVFEPRLIVTRGHPLLELAGKLSSYIHIRVAATEHKLFNQTLLLGDDNAYLHNESSANYNGSAHFNDRHECKRLLDLFNTMWHVAKIDPNLRRMTV